MRFIRSSFSSVLPALLFILTLEISHAGSATWNLNPTSSDWNTAANWTPATVPNGPLDTGTFDVSNTNDISITASTEVNRIIFNPGASAFTFSINSPLHVDGSIVNQSAGPQTFVVGPPFNTYVEFDGTSKAGTLTTYRALSNPASNVFGAFIFFFSSASAEGSTLIADGPTVRGTLGGDITFQDSSTAARSTLIANKGVSGASGGTIYFYATSTGAEARVEVFGNGYLDLVTHSAPGVTIGSLEGNGQVFLGRNNLTVGANQLNTTFGGVIQGVGGSLTKTGSGKLILTNANSYTGGTTVMSGTLLLGNRFGSGTGDGAVQVDGGTFGGRGTVAGPVTVGTGTGLGAFLAPEGRGSQTATFTIQSSLTLNADATYSCDLNSSAIATADEVAANGVTINRGAQISLDDLGAGALTSGTVFTIISNTAPTPIAGVFGNLADGSTLTIGSNTYQVSYEGGDGNDLTLTVQ
jgi:autotransporter-associated beta strand protein